jgi:hypothetical protein
MTAVLGREARGTAASGNVPERSVQHRLVHCVVGPGSLSGPCGSHRRSDYVFVSDVDEVDEETLGTRAGLVGEAPVVVEPSTSSSCEVHWPLGCSLSNPLSSSPSRSPLRVTLWREGLSGDPSNPPSCTPCFAAWRGYSTRSVESPTTSVNVAP